MDLDKVWKMVEAEFCLHMAFALSETGGEFAEMRREFTTGWARVLQWLARGIQPDVVAAAEAVAAGRICSFRVEGQEEGAYYHFAWIQASDSDGQACERLDRFEVFAQPDESGCTGCWAGDFHDDTQPLPSPEEVIVHYFADCGVVVQAWVGPAPPDTSS